MDIFDKNPVLRNAFQEYAQTLSESEGINENDIRDRVASGEAVILFNPAHSGVIPVMVGRGASVKVNANIGTSPFSCCREEEIEKLKAAEKAGADTVMDLSIGEDLDSLRTQILSLTAMPVGTVPLYAAARRVMSGGGMPEDIDMEDVFDEIERQAKQGVDFMTVHTGLDSRAAKAAEEKRVLGIVSRGGSILSRWMVRHGLENPLLENFDRIVDIAIKHNVTLSLGDGLRPGAICDAGDEAQWREVINLGRQAEFARSRGVQCMIEGPGHVSLDQIEAQIKGIKRLTGNAPLYVLGPLVIDNSPGYDHIAGAIGAAAAVKAGADFLCYLTPAEHLTLPDISDVRSGVMASRIAAAAGETANGRVKTVGSQRLMAEARRNLDWEAVKKIALDGNEVEKRRENHKNREECAMCGEFCSVKLLRDSETV